MLVRDFIRKRLGAYFAQAHEMVVGSVDRGGALTPSINFQTLMGRWHFQRVVSKLYEETKGQWLTPVELFRPHYSNILTDYIIEHAVKNVKNGVEKCKHLHIIELGAGRATHAYLVIERLRQKYPEVLPSLKYTIVEASLSLIELQHNILQPLLEDDINIKFIRRDLGMLENDENCYDEFLRCGDNDNDEQVVVFALEVFDNLPHDKVVRSHSKNDNGQESSVMQVELVRGEEPGDYNEYLCEMKDSLISRICGDSEHSPVYSPGRHTGDSRWVPSVACNFIRELYRSHPDALLFVADFDWLPSPDLTSESDYDAADFDYSDGAPLITDMSKRDYPSYRNAPECCDILFPTDFLTLSKYTRSLLRGSSQDVHVYKQGEFFQKFGGDELTLTKSFLPLTNYNPLIDEFENFSVMTTSKRKN